MEGADVTSCPKLADRPVVDLHSGSVDTWEQLSDGVEVQANVRPVW